MDLDLSVVIPVRNEESILLDAASAFSQDFDRIIGKGRWQYVLVENGSSDQTPEICQNIVNEWPPSLMMRMGQANIGRAMRAGILTSKGTWILTMDVDQVWDPPFLEWAWSNRNVYDLVLGSKRVDPTLSDQGYFREFLSSGRMALLTFLFGSVLADTHGMKLMRAESMSPIVESCTMERGQFQTELALRALRQRLWVAEVPHPHAEKRPARNLMIKKIIQNLYDVIRTRRIVNALGYSGTLRYRRFCREDIEKGLFVGRP